MDKLTKEQRRKNMQAVKNKNSRIEILLGKNLWNKGLRYRKNDKTVFGKPDFTFKKHKIAVFCDSEFWHGKDWIVRKNDHKTNQEFWQAKIERNIERDKEVNRELEKQGWSILRFWGKEIEKDLLSCVLKVENEINSRKMNFTEKISIEEISGSKFRIRVVEPENNKEAALTHYLHNQRNGVAKFYKKEALEYTKELLQYKYPEADITSKVAEEALQYKIFKTFDIPFPSVENPTFKFIDLFAGIGGFRLALQNLGGKCIFTSEWDKEAKRTYKANFGETPFGDITKERTKSYIPDGFDILCAGFPCQAFSIAGKRGGFEDTRGTLFFDVAEIIKRKQPKAVFLENVKGLFNHNGGKTLDTILNVLRNDLNYFVPEPQIINAKDFGVPQNRERIFIVGFHKSTGITEFEYPKPIDKKTTFSDVKEKDVVPTKYYLSTQYVQTLYNHKARHESKGNGFGFEIIPDDGISNAIVVGGMGRERNLVIDHRITDFTPTTHIKGEVNREGIRKMTPREWAHLQGFPNNFIIPVADASAYKQFGNSVAVPAVQATAREILTQLRKKGKKKMIKGNKGEWSEIYTLLKIIADKQLFAGDSNLNKIESLIFPIIKVLRDESNGTFEFSYNDDLVIVKNNDKEFRVSVNEFQKQAHSLLMKLKEKTSATFSVPEIENFINSFNIKSLKAKSSVKSDIRIVIHDQRTGTNPELGFSIKSQLGGASTLLNAGKTTNFVYKVDNLDLTAQEIDGINAIDTRSKIKDRIEKIKILNGNLQFEKLESSVFENNLVLIDSALPKIISEMLLLFFSSNHSKISDLVSETSETNPLGYNLDNNHPFYSYKIKRFLTDIALGMMPATVWRGELDATGGYLVVKENGDVLCYHIYNRNEFENYLFFNTKLETASSNKHEFGKIEVQNDKTIFKLNLQIRFIS